MLICELKHFHDDSSLIFRLTDLSELLVRIDSILTGSNLIVQLFQKLSLQWSAHLDLRGAMTILNAYHIIMSVMGNKIVLTTATKEIAVRFQKFKNFLID